MRRTAGLRGRAGTFVVGEEGGREGRRGEGEEVEGYEEEFVEGADGEEDVLCVVSVWSRRLGEKGGRYFVGVVEVEEFASVLIDHLVALAAACHCQGGVHVHVMACQI